MHSFGSKTCAYCRGSFLRQVHQTYRRVSVEVLVSPSEIPYTPFNVQSGYLHWHSTDWFQLSSSQEKESTDMCRTSTLNGVWVYCIVDSFTYIQGCRKRSILIRKSRRKINRYKCSFAFKKVPAKRHKNHATTKVEPFLTSWFTSEWAKRTSEST